MRFDVGLGLALGSVGLHLLPHLPSVWAVLLGIAVSGSLAWYAPRTRIALCVALGFGWAWLHVAHQLAAAFPDTLARAPLVIEGYVASIPSVDERRTRWLFDITHTRDEHGTAIAFSGRVRLACYRDCPTLAAGERWRIAVRLKPRHGGHNPGGFDYERWLFEQQIAATGYPRGRAAFERLDAGPGRYWLTRWRQRLAEHLAAVLADAPQLGLIQALTLGERGALERDTWDSFTRTGTNHLVAISGLHVGLVAGGLYWLMQWLWSRSAALTNRLAAPRAAALFGLLAAVGYAGLAGFAISTQRALIMLAVVFGARFWARTLRSGQALLLALVGVLIWDPQAVLSYGFWLSFGAVAVLLLHLGQRLPSRDLWTRWGRAQWAIGLGLLPLLLLFFGQASLIAPLVNVVAVPLFSALLPLALIASLLSLLPLSGAELPLCGVAEVLDWCVRGLDWLATLPGAAVQLPARPLWVWAAALLGALLWLAPAGLPGRWAGWVLLLPLVTVRPAAPSWGEVWFTLLDVGQGLAAVIETQDGVLVYDAGPAYPGGFDSGAMTVAPVLQARGIARIDRLILSHADLDHAGGAAGLLARIPADRVLTGEPHRLGLADAEPCVAGEQWQWSGVDFAIQHPAADTTLTGNDASCVLEIRTAAHQTIVLTGDASARIEQRLVAQRGAEWPITVLIAGHHGSATATSARLLEATRPEWVLIASGYANQFGFPATAVRERLAARGIATLNTALVGAIQFKLGASGWIDQPQGWRERAGRLWTHRPVVSM